MEELDKKVRGLNPEDEKVNNSKLLYGLYNSKLYFEKLHKNNKWYGVTHFVKTSTIWNLKAALIVLISVGLWSLHFFIPKGAATYQLGFFTISAHGFNDVQIFIWFISRKLMVIVPMVIWFVTYHSWWRYAVLSPLIFYLYQFWEAYQDGYIIIESYGNYKVFPLVFLSIILMLGLSRIVRKHSHSLDTYEHISTEIDHLIKKLGEERSGVGDYRKRYEQLRSKLVMQDSADTTLTELTRLQKELQGKMIN
ncbi:hypothetical protein LVD13_03770 [Flavobacteriaceae bacterium D16]|nr:hypothetical protein [Flavobacteriaceae bacterium D16]